MLKKNEKHSNNCSWSGLTLLDKQLVFYCVVLWHQHSRFLKSVPGSGCLGPWSILGSWHSLTGVKNVPCKVMALILSLVDKHTYMYIIVCIHLCMLRVIRIFLRNIYIHVYIEHGVYTDFHSSLAAASPSTRSPQMQQWLRNSRIWRQTVIAQVCITHFDDWVFQEWGLVGCWSNKSKCLFLLGHPSITTTSETDPNKTKNNAVTNQGLIWINHLLPVHFTYLL